MRIFKPVQVFSLMLSSTIAILAGCTPDFERQTADGRYRVSIKPAPDPIPINTLFALNLKVEKTEGGTLSPSTVIQVDATMPAHKHGMNTVPIVLPGNAPGAYLVQGLLFHMSGLWEIAVKIQEGGSISEAKFRVRL